MCLRAMVIGCIAKPPCGLGCTTLLEALHLHSSSIKIGWFIQVVIGLSGGEILYFEMDLIGQLLETEKKDTSSEISCMDVAPIPEGKQRTRFLAVGSIDSTVRIMSLDPGECLNGLSLQVGQAAIVSLC